MLPSPTSRLRFREMCACDVESIATLDFHGSRGPEGWVDWNVHNYAEHGFGLWILERHDGAFVGDCGLTVQDVEGEPMIEIGWHVQEPLRRQGFAVEAAHAVRAAAEDHGVEHLVAIIRPDNTASQAVARRLGLVLEREIHKLGGPALLFGADLRSKPAPG